MSAGPTKPAPLIGDFGYSLEYLESVWDSASERMSEFDRMRKRENARLARERGRDAVEKAMAPEGGG